MWNILTKLTLCNRMQTVSNQLGWWNWILLLLLMFSRTPQWSWFPNAVYFLHILVAVDNNKFLTLSMPSFFWRGEVIKIIKKCQRTYMYRTKPDLTCQRMNVYICSTEGVKMPFYSFSLLISWFCPTVSCLNTTFVLRKEKCDHTIGLVQK